MSRYAITSPAGHTGSMDLNDVAVADLIRKGYEVRLHSSQNPVNLVG